MADIDSTLPLTGTASRGAIKLVPVPCDSG